MSPEGLMPGEENSSLVKCKDTDCNKPALILSTIGLAQLEPRSSVDLIRQITVQFSNIKLYL